VDGHGVVGFQVVDEAVGARPVALRIPPESFEREREPGGRSVVCERAGEGGGVHGETLVASCQWSVVSGQWSVVSGQRSAVSWRWAGGLWFPL
jgi:hypothetical protein